MPVCNALTYSLADDGGRLQRRSPAQPSRHDRTEVPSPHAALRTETDSCARKLARASHPQRVRRWRRDIVTLSGWGRCVRIRTAEARAPLVCAGGGVWKAPCREGLQRDYGRRPWHHGSCEQGCARSRWNQHRPQHRAPNGATAQSVSECRDRVPLLLCTQGYVCQVCARFHNISRWLWHDG